MANKINPTAKPLWFWEHRAGSEGDRAGRKFIAINYSVSQKRKGGAKLSTALNIVFIFFLFILILSKKKII